MNNYEWNSNSVPRDIPPNAHPLVKFLFERMKEERTKYIEVADRAGVGYGTIRKWRRGRAPTIMNIEACLNVMGYEIRAVRMEERTGR